MPPSTVSVAPVTNELWSLARNSMARATSSGAACRPIGISSSKIGFISLETGRLSVFTQSNGYVLAQVRNVLGAYGLYLVAEHGVNPFAGILAAAVIAAVVSLPVSLLVLRLSGGYFAVATLVVAAVFQIAATLSPSVGGTTGVSVPGLAGYTPVLREALIYWATLVVAVAGSTCWCGGPSGWTPGRPPATRSPRPASASGWAAAGGWPTWSRRAAPGRWGWWSRCRPCSSSRPRCSTSSTAWTCCSWCWPAGWAPSSYGAWYLVIVGGLAVAATLAAPRGLWGLVSGRFGWSLLPVGYRIRSQAEKSKE
jgi:branched-chain amino acid transport system permease protein